MCGIFGFVSQTIQSNSLKSCTDKISHRGPDAEGFYTHGSVHFGHRRLAIHDLTEGGRQPMTSPSGRFVIIFNGEIYNFKKLIETHQFICKSTSDTEVLLLLVEKFGFKKAIELIIGMFAIAIHDTVENKIYLARDCFGEKPLYYYYKNDDFIFASELKAIYPLCQTGQINLEALRSYFYYNYVPEITCILENAFKLAPGHILEFDITSKALNVSMFWSADSIYKNQKATYKGSFDQASKDLEKILSEVIEEQLASDVPIGAFLSGGIDSSLVCAIAQKVSPRVINTFSIGFNTPEYNEAHFAQKIAGHLKTNHTELYATPRDCIDLISDLSRIYDEPMSDSSQIPTLLLSRLTKGHVTVCLSGDGGDELFAGYNRYIIGNQINNFLNITPLALRKIIKDVLLFTNNSAIKPLSPMSYRKFYKLGQILDSQDGYDFYESLITHWRQESPLRNKSIKPFRYSFGEGDSFVEKMMLLDLKTYLPSDILVKVDRASMSNSLETRAPLLDKRIAEFALKLPLKYKLHGASGKHILKDILHKHVPKQLLDRPKMGFGIPLDNWLRDELKQWAEEQILLTRENVFLDYTIIKKKWDEHLSQKKNWQFHLWDVLLFQEWYNIYISELSQNSVRHEN